MQGLARMQATGSGGRHHHLPPQQQQRRRLADLQRAPLAAAVPQKQQQQQQKTRCIASPLSLGSPRHLSLSRKAAAVIARSSSSAAAAASSSSSSSFNNDDAGGDGLPPAVTQAAKFLAVAGAAAAFAAWKAGYGPVILSAIDASILSGAVPAFSLVFLSELGDKTFFLAALLAARAGKRVAFLGSVAALAAMSVVSAAIGAAAQRVPETFVSSSLPVSKWASVALLAYFGVRTLKAAWDAPPDAAGEELAAAREELGEGAGADGAKASSSSSSSSSSGSSEKKKPRGAAIDRDSSSALARALEVGTIIFLAEWGDRSMLATIALAAAQGPVGVAAGATAGHALATAIAVLGGALVSRWLSERAIGFIGGGLFLVFAALTQAGVM